MQADPTVARQLLANGQLVEDAGYRASAALPLEVHPGDLDRSQRVFAQQLGVCPSYIRPTSGVHTPLTARLASSRSMRLVTWDVHRDRVGQRIDRGGSHSGGSDGDRRHLLRAGERRESHLNVGGSDLPAQLTRGIGG